eukprot:CAMPEP_0203752530 /NCGR_PEP_ID=MMETSP0098-20131031/6439_1 /ASSEMBLY_ACC=CAM_ASM_000208 /TAXON_ID=96639 /ORGANISM=" , Strain NY0313808BC1" /LENGTH=749 /DNA_ID=CAMNT_0050642739 /DNA_START=515 /DNA_END=2764 /DNA_ORIENTATION=-
MCHGDTSCALTFDSFANDGSYDMKFGRKSFFSSGDACIWESKTERCVGNGKLVFLQKHVSTGSDVLGGYKVFENSYAFPGENTGVWAIRVYVYNDTSTVIFEQEFLRGLSGTDRRGITPKRACSKGTSSWYPAFTLPSSSSSLGFLRYNGVFAGSNSGFIGDWKSGTSTYQGQGSGPFAIFSDECVVVASSANQFMSSSNIYDKTRNQVGFGVMGSVTNIPKGHVLRTMLHVRPRIGPDGVRQAFASWGNKLRALYGTRRLLPDTTVQYLQFSTDNGAYYYYKTEPKQNYEETIRQVKQVSIKTSIPFKQWLMDSWWYYKGKGGGVKNWTAMPKVFPNGIVGVLNYTKWDIVAHNRYWASDTDYAIQNGGKWKFVVESSLALPIELGFWVELLTQAKKWGLTTYEQDWLNIQFTGMRYTLQNVHAARTWLMQMGQAAEMLNIRIQYCMSLPRHVLQTLEIPAVTQIRGSRDYQPGNTNWRGVGITSIFTDALGLATSKDNFWSNASDVRGTRYGRVASEPAGRLHSIVSTLSLGAVAPSDQMNSFNRDLIMRSVATTGRILQPDKPAAMTDRGFSSYRTPNRLDMIWSTYSNISGWVYTYILSAQARPFNMSLRDIYASQATQFVSFESGGKVNQVEYSFPKVPKTDPVNFKYYVIAPILGRSGWLFLGEAETKWVPMSRHRFSKLRIDEDFFSVNIQGGSKEIVHVVARSPKGDLVRTHCVLPEAEGSEITLVGSNNKLACSPIAQIV